MTRLKITRIGDSCGVVLPLEVLEQLAVKEGDFVMLIETPESSFRIVRWDPEFDEQMAIAEEIMARDREGLRRLAKL